MQYQHFDCEIEQSVARVCFIGYEAPPLVELCDEFMDLMLRLQEDRAVRVILITDGDHSFEMVPDLDRIAQSRCAGAGFDAMTPNLEIAHRIITLIQETAKPVVAASRGTVRDSGLGLFLAADIRLAGSTATFTSPDMNRGLLPDWGLLFNLPRLIGPSRALEFLWTHRTIGAGEADRLGLVDRVIADEVWEEELAATMQRLTSLPQPAVRLAKLATQQSPQFDMTSMLSYEFEAQQQCWQSLETVEGMAAFLDGREPEFAPRQMEEEE